MTRGSPDWHAGTTGAGGPPTRFLRVDSACDRYELAWRGGQRPHLEQSVKSAPQEHRVELLRELLVLEIELRFGAGERPVPGDYVDRFAGSGDTILGFGRHHTELGRRVRGTPY